MNMSESQSSIISGKVRDTKGNAIGGAKITCNGHETITLFDGTYKLTDLKPSTYTVTVNLKGFQSQDQSAEAKANEENIIDFDLAEAFGDSKIYGYIYDTKTKKPITSGGTIILILPATNRYAHINRDGYFEFDNLSPDTYEICTAIQEYVDKKITLTVAQGKNKKIKIYCAHEPVEEPPWG